MNTRNYLQDCRERTFFCRIGSKEKQNTSVSDLLVMEQEILELKIADMEDAMYELDGERLTEILSEFENYQYSGVPMKDVCIPAKRKVEMSDYISAVEMVIRWKKDLIYKESS